MASKVKSVNAVHGFGFFLSILIASSVFISSSRHTYTISASTAFAISSLLVRLASRSFKPDFLAASAKMRSLTLIPVGLPSISVSTREYMKLTYASPSFARPLSVRILPYQKISLN